MTLHSDHDLVWIGLAHVAAAPGSEVLAAGKNAFTNVVGRAPSTAAFEAAVGDACRALGLEVQSLEEIEDYARRFAGTSIPAEIAEAREELERGQEIAFARFFAYAVD